MVAHCFGFTVANAPAQAFALLLVSFARGDQPLGSCTLYPRLPGATASTFTSAAGSALLGLALPNASALVGTVLVAQWGVLAPGGPALGIAVASDGLFVVVGA